MPRLRLYDIRMSRLNETVGRCQSDIFSLANYVNSAQRRLLMCREAGDEGWWGTFAEVQFTNVSRTNPYITCPREIARIEKLTVCRAPVMVQNQYYEYMDFGNGRMPQCCAESHCLPMGFTRNNAVTFSDLVNPPKFVRVYWSDPADVQAAKRAFVQGVDRNNNTVYTQDSLNRVQGEFVAGTSPFADTLYEYNALSGLQKDATQGPVHFYQVDPNTGEESLMLTMQPAETVAGYRRYYFNNLPLSCCAIPGNTSTTVQVTAIVKLELIPVVVDTDYLLLHNLEAIIEECQSLRYSEVDNEAAKKMAQEKHLQAVRLLQGELVHYLGKERPAVNFSPFGSARLERQLIGTMI